MHCFFPSYNLGEKKKKNDKDLVIELEIWI